MRALITGASGFLGGHLLDALRADGCEAFGLTRQSTANPALIQGDVMDPDSLRSVVGRVKPDQVFHLAAQSLPAVSWKEPAATCYANILGTIHLLDAVRQHAPSARVIVAGSSSAYAGQSTPIGEDAAMLPSSPYAVSKMAADHAARVYGAHHRIAVLRVRPFFLIGPGKTGDAASDFARGIVAIERGQLTHLDVGNLEAVRDFLDVRDGISAFRAIATRGEAGSAYNICSGVPCTVRALLDSLKACALCTVREQVDAARIRPLDEPVKVGDPARLVQLGWKPVHSLSETARSIMEYWRCK